MTAEARNEVELHEHDLKQTECGILVICRPEAPFEINGDITETLIAGGNRLQHRGEQSSGFVIHSTETPFEQRGLGPLNAVINREQIAGFRGDAYAAAVHLRWTTNGATEYGNVQPIPINIGDYRTAHLMVNGNTPGADILRQLLPYELPDTASDTVIMAHVMANAPCDTFEDKFMWMINQPVVKNSAFCAVAMSGDTVIAARDRFGLHPLVIGEMEMEDTKGPMHVIASEDIAIRKMGGKATKAINPGEVVKFDKKGFQVLDDGVEEAIPRECIFEYLYFEDAATFHVRNELTPKQWRTIAYKRYMLGELMARELIEEIAEVDFLCDSPNSGRWFTAGLHNASGKMMLPIIQRILNSRSFTQGVDASSTEQRVRDKLEFLEDAAFIEGKHIGIGDDSLIHGNTARTIIRILKNLDAKGVTFFLSMPQVRDACHLGVNLKNKEEMISVLCGGDEELIAWAIGAVRVCYAKHEAVIKAIKGSEDIVIPAQYNGDNPELLYMANELCPGCVTGKHIVDKQGNLEHYVPLLAA